MIKIKNFIKKLFNKRKNEKEQFNFLFSEEIEDLYQKEKQLQMERKQLEAEKKKLAEEKRSLKETRRNTEREKKKLKALRTIFEDSSSKEKIENIYILQFVEEENYHIVRLSEDECFGTILTNIFNPNMVIKKSGGLTDGVLEYFPGEGLFCSVTPVCKCDKSLLTYVNGEASKLRLLELYYELNGIVCEDILYEAKRFTKWR